jgi:hypothetical protein
MVATVRMELRNEEMSSLRALAAAQRKTTAAIAPEHRDKLLGCGYALMYGEILEITPVGQAKLVYETTRANWFPSA